MSGLAPDSQVGSFLYSTPVSLGTLTVGADGMANGRITIPASVPPGNHTLQFTGWTPSNEPVILSAGITVKPQVRRLSTSVTFDEGSRLTRFGRADVRRFVADSSALATPVTTVVTYPGFGTPPEVCLAKARAQVVVRALKDRGMTGSIRIAASSPAKASGVRPGSVRITATS
jgi:hypothetical protein